MFFCNCVHTSAFAGIVITEGAGNNNILKNKADLGCNRVSHSCSVGTAPPWAAVRRAFSVTVKLV